MSSTPSDRRIHCIAELKLMIVRQQEAVASLFRAGQKAKAREARGKLLQLLNQFDVMQELPEQAA